MIFFRMLLGGFVGLMLVFLYTHPSSHSANVALIICSFSTGALLTLVGILLHRTERDAARAAAVLAEIDALNRPPVI